MIEPRSIQSQWFHMLAHLTTRPQQHMCTVYVTKINYQNHKLNFVITSFWRVCPIVRDVALPKMKVHNFISRLITCPNFKFLTLVVSEFLLNLPFKKWFLNRSIWGGGSGGLVPPDNVKKFILKYLLISKKTCILVQDNWILGDHLERFRRGGTPKLGNIFVLNFSWY